MLKQNPLFRSTLWTAVLISVLLTGCQARFPTDQFVRVEGDLNRFLTFYPDGRWEGFYAGNLETFGQYTTARDQITFESDLQCEDLGFSEPATYLWVYEDDSLTFQVSGSDPCADRVKRLTSGPFKKSQ